MKKAIAILAMVGICGVAMAEEVPVMVSLVEPVQYPSCDCDVTGFRLSLIYGECRNFKGFDLGLLNSSYGRFYGLAIGGANIASERMYGAQFGLVNYNGNPATGWDDISIGWQAGLINYAGSFCGIQEGGLNIVDQEMTGLQSALVNIADCVRGCQFGLVNTATDMHGAQLGYYFLCVNYAERLTGCQLGIVNIAGRVERGIQLGIVNVNMGNGWAPVLPVINGGF